MEEVWVDIKGYESLYQISNLGRARSLEKGQKKKNNSTHILKGKINKIN